MNHIDSINERANELAKIEGEMRALATQKAEILASLRESRMRIEEIEGVYGSKSTTTPIFAVDGLDEHTRKCLKVKGIEFLEDVAKMTEQKVQQIPNFGGTCIEQIREALHKHGLKFAA